MRVWIEVLARPVDGMRPVHVSVGAAAWRPGLEAGQLYRMADAVMYQAKFAGGRRVLVHDARDDDSEIASPRRA
jgi:PleD family two-component response regulator